MARNMEIKAHVHDRHAFEQRVARLPVRAREELVQCDTFYRVRSGRLKLREFGDGSAELIQYERDDRPEAKLSEYIRVAVADGPAMRVLLANALGVRGTVRKRRTVFLVGKTRVHLDDVEGLGCFAELEVVLDAADTLEDGRSTAAQLMEALGIAASDRIAGAYIDLLESKQQSPSV